MSNYLSAVQAAAVQIGAQADHVFKGSLPRTALVDSAGRVLARLQQDIGMFHHDSVALFSCDPVGRHQLPAGHALARMFIRWRKEEPSVTALVTVMAAHFGVPAASPALQAALMLGIAADVETTNPYHSNHHFREVVAIMARLIEVNNCLAREGHDGVAMLDHNDIALCLCAAAAHDLLHDGRNNAPTGPESWRQYRLENAAIVAAEPFMKIARMNAEDIERVRVMIRVTDVSAPAGIDSPHRILRKICRKDATVHVPSELVALTRDKKLLAMSAMMSDADLGPSGATNYIFCRMQTHLFSRENPGFSPTDKNIGGFLGFVLENTFISPAAQQAAQPSLSLMVEKVNDRIRREASMTG